MTVGPLEILVILVIGLLIFGPNRLPELARTVGRGLREVRKLQRMVQGELEDVMSEPDSSAGRTTAAREKPAVNSGDTSSGNGVSGNGTSSDGADGETRGSEPAPEAGRDSD